MRNAFSHFYRRLRHSSLAWHAINTPARLRYFFARSPLTPVEARAVDDLEKTGIAIAHVSDLCAPGIFPELLNYANERLANPEVTSRLQRLVRLGAGGSKTKNSFLVDLWGGEHILDPTHPFIRFSLSQPVLSVVNGYLGMFSKFREFFLQATAPIPAGTMPFASQRWHADPDDRKLVKIFLYLNDVDETAGPLSYIRYSHSAGKWRDFFPYAPKIKSRHPDPAMIERIIPPEDIAVAAGKAGTIIFCDTSGVHRGGYATGRERIMYTSVYTSRASALPTRFRCLSDSPDNMFEAPAARYAAIARKL